MRGYDREEAVSYIVGKLQTAGLPRLASGKDAAGLVRQALDADFEYMRSAGVLTEEGMMGDAFYDDDDAFEFLLDRMSRERGLGEDEQDELADFIDQYMDLQQQYMEEKGLLSWS